MADRKVLEQLVTKETADCYYIRVPSEHSWARVFMVEGRRPNGSGWGQISIVSDYGNFGHSWTGIGERSFRDFLCGLRFDYVMDKLGRERFDTDTAIKSAQRALCAKRRADDINRLEAREMYNALGGIIAETSDGWYAQLVDVLGGFWSEWEAWNWNAPNTWTADSRGLWQHIWPKLIEQFRAEAQAHGS